MELAQWSTDKAGETIDPGSAEHCSGLLGPSVSIGTQLFLHDVVDVVVHS